MSESYSSQNPASTSNEQTVYVIYVRGYDTDLEWEVSSIHRSLDNAKARLQANIVSTSGKPRFELTHYKLLYETLED